MTLPLSVAIVKGTPQVDGFTTNPYNDSLGAALIGSMRPAELENFWVFMSSASNESACEYVQRSLYRAWPHLGATVRTWPALAAELEQLQILPWVKPYQHEYRQEIHKSLWCVITDLHAAGRTKAEISELLGRHQL